MSVPWLKNLLGVPQSELQTLHIPWPHFELAVHISIKSVQAGTLLGSLLVAPIIQAIQGPRDCHSFQTAIVNGGFTGAKVGLVAGPLICLATMRNMSEAGAYDRCYRLRLNKNQLLVDRACLVGAAVGAGMSGPAGCVAGVDLGILAAAFLNGFRK